MLFQTFGYEGLELSTQILIKEALREGIEVEVLDANDNFIALTRGNKTEYVKQATRTSADTYISALIMGNKSVTKKILKKHGVRTPEGAIYHDIRLALQELDRFKNSDVVVKPNSTNFGKGVAIIKKSRLEEDYRKAVKTAFEHDNSIIAEEFVPGDEYRVLVIGDQTAAVLQRIPANVEGDGKNDIEKLIAEKNRNPLRGEGYKTPLEKIRAGEMEKDFLALRGKNFQTVPEKGEIVFLRENSNISSGGDSLDRTDEISDSYRQIAVKAAGVVGAGICGVDIIIQDINSPPRKDNHAVIELNFNPAIHMHNYPWKGKNRRVEKKILSLLGF